MELYLFMLTALVFGNAFFTLRLAKKTSEGLRASVNLTEILRERQEALHMLLKLQRGHSETEEISQRSHLRRLCYKLTGNHELGNELFPAREKPEPLTALDIEKAKEALEDLGRLVEKNT